ncbi:MAG TPA: sigma-70 family RNA polymerase sigma factor [Hyphomicrobiaceae bacterium]|nr:sigma-70 family RNA polymerase sigma factor [Hyphomicrobiaceae bacterium]
MTRVHDSGPGPGNRPGTEAGTAAEEAAVLARIRAGDSAAFRQVIDRHMPSLLAVARRMLKADGDAEDIVQEALVRVWHHAGTLELGPGGLRPWLRRVVTNLCLDHLRRHRLTSVVAEVPETPEAPDQARGLEEADLAKRVGAALAALPERQRVALTLFHYEGLSQIEVGDMLGISDEAVESLLARARRSLKAALKDEWRQLLPENE